MRNSVSKKNLYSSRNSGEIIYKDLLAKPLILKFDTPEFLVYGHKDPDDYSSDFGYWIDPSTNKSHGLGHTISINGARKQILVLANEEDPINYSIKPSTENRLKEFGWTIIKLTNDALSVLQNDYYQKYSLGLYVG